MRHDALNMSYLLHIPIGVGGRGQLWIPQDDAGHCVVGVVCDGDGGRLLKKSNDIPLTVRLILDWLSWTLRVLTARTPHLVVVLGRACWNAYSWSCHVHVCESTELTIGTMGNLGWPSKYCQCFKKKREWHRISLLREYLDLDLRCYLLSLFYLVAYRSFSFAHFVAFSSKV